MKAKKFKMAAAELKIGQNSPMHTLKLKFEAVILADRMFLAYDEEEGIRSHVLAYDEEEGIRSHVFWHMLRRKVFKFEVWIPDEPIKIQEGGQKTQNGCQKAQI